MYLCKMKCLIICLIICSNLYSQKLLKNSDYERRMDSISIMKLNLSLNNYVYNENIYIKLKLRKNVHIIPNFKIQGNSKIKGLRLNSGPSIFYATGLFITY